LLAAALQSRPQPTDPPPLQLIGTTTNHTTSTPLLQLTSLPHPIPHTLLSTPSTPNHTSLSLHSPGFSQTSHHPIFTSPTTPIPVALSTSPTYTPIHQSIIHTTPYHQQPYPPTPLYTSVSPLSTAIPFGSFQPPQQTYLHAHQSPSNTLSLSLAIVAQPQFCTPKIELNTFDGTNPLEWVFQAEQFFSFYSIPHENRLALASFYMKGDALSWFKWMHQNNQLFDWSSFAKALELRFGPSTYENFQAQLFKLRQYGTVTDYQTQFEKLGNRVIGLPPEALLNCFVSGLIPEIRHELAVQKPYTITQAIGLAKLIEAKLTDSKGRPPKPFASTPNSPANSTSNGPKTPSTLPIVARQSSPTTLTNTSNTKFPIRRLTAAQMQERRAQGLCYNCDEKYVMGHRCATCNALSNYLIILLDDMVYVYILYGF